MRLFLLVIIFSFLTSQDVIKNVILYPSQTAKNNNDIQYIHYILNEDNNLILTKTEHYYRSGQLMSTENYSNDGILIDLNEWYYENGQIKSLRLFDDSGVRVGEWTDYYENGQIEYTRSYENGIITGFQTWYYSDGNKMREGSLINGLKDGTWINYYENGQVEYERIYSNGKVVEKIVLPNPKRSRL